MITKESATSIILPGCFNAHAHLRDAGAQNYDFLDHVARVQEAHFDACVAMPNTKPPILHGEDARRYVDRICTAAPNLCVAAVCYLTLMTTPQMVREARRAGVRAYKLYPAGATTNSAQGVPLKRLPELDRTLCEMAEQGMVLCLHGEDPDVPLPEREAAFLGTLRFLAETYPRLRLVFEHVSSAAAIDTCLVYENVWMTVTPHHLVLTEADVPLSPHHVCMPIAKTAADREALCRLVASGHPRVAAGLDDAPHPIQDKVRSSGPVPFGIWNTEAALGVYARVFAERGALSQLPGFLWSVGANLYGIPSREAHPRRLMREAMMIRSEPDPSKPQPFLAGQTLEWRVVSEP